MSYDSWKLASPPWYDLPEPQCFCRICTVDVDWASYPISADPDNLLCDDCQETYFCDGCDVELEDDRKLEDKEAMCDECEQAEKEYWSKKEEKQETATYIETG